MSEQLRLYMRSKYDSRKKRAIEYLGGRCVVCGTVDHLEFDHIDPLHKSFTITRQLSSSPWEVIISELDKCQLLCQAHHLEKTVGDKDAKNSHGTLSSYRYCKCEVCKAAKSAYNKQYKLSKKN
jgi:hypothetical protein